jgi:ribosomal protein S18 acetylase RimI-like enzyme
VIIIQIIASTDTTINQYADQFLGLQTIYDQAGYPYWILVDGNQVIGLIVIAQEPRDLIQPAGTHFMQIHVFQHNLGAVQRLIDETIRIAEEQPVAFILTTIDANETETLSLFENEDWELFEERVKMGCRLENPVSPETDLVFSRASPDEATQMLPTLEKIAQGLSDNLLQTSIRNMRHLPQNELHSVLSQMDLIRAYRNSLLVGIMSFTGPNISMIGVTPEEQGKGYSTVLTQWAKAHLAESGFFHASLRVSAKNDSAIKIYEKQGFRVIEQTKYYIHKFPQYWKEP